MRVFNILNLGAGWQSSRILLGACLGEFPKFDAAIFADTQWEPKAVYRNLEFLKTEAALAGIPLMVSTKGNIRADHLRFRQTREGRLANMPAFIREPDGSLKKLQRQCTKEYKIEVVESVIRHVILDLKPRQRIPKGVQVRQWFGISADESSRASFPGRWETIKSEIGTDLLGFPVEIKKKFWRPIPWRQNVYPLLNAVYLPDRSVLSETMVPQPNYPLSSPSKETREDCGDWLAENYPGHEFPRSACIGCPFRTNAEWTDMRDNRPEEFEDACEFDDLQRQADVASRSKKALLVGLPFLHRQLVPLRMANLEGTGERKGGGCGTLLDGLDGLCNT